MLLLSIICTRHYVEVILNELGVIGHENNTYCKANKSCDEIIDENAKHTKRFSFKITENEKNNYRSCTGFQNYIRIQQVHVPSLHRKYAAQNKFLNPFPMPSSL